MNVKDAVFKVNDFAIYSVTEFAKQQKKIRGLTVALIGLGIGGYFAAAFIMDQRARITDLENQVKIILQTIAGNVPPEMPVGE